MSVNTKTPLNTFQRLHKQIAAAHATFTLLLIGLVTYLFPSANHPLAISLLIALTMGLSYILTIYLIRQQIIYPLRNLRTFADELIQRQYQDDNHPKHPDVFIHLNNVFMQLSSAQENHFTQLEHQTQLLKKQLDHWKHAERTLNRLTGRLQLATQAASMGIWDWYLDEDSHDWDKHTYALLGMPEQSVTPSLSEWLRRVHPADLPKLQQFIQQIQAGDVQQYRTDYRILLPDNSVRQLAFFAQTALDVNRKVTRVTAVQMDVTEQKLTEKRILYLATHDPLTGLYSRNGLKEIIQKNILQGESLRQFAVLHLDIDRFKNINDALGHFTGDELLQIVSVKISRLLRKTDAIARLGGDEFVIVFSPALQPEEVRLFSKRILEVFSIPHALDESDITLTASIGSAIYPYDGTDAETLLRYADISMQQVKANGGNGYQAFTSSMVKDAESMLQTEQRLRKAIDQEVLEVFYQPKVDTHTKAVVGAEALVRWPKPDGSYVSPANFIPLAEERGLIRTLNILVLQKTLRQIQQWGQAGYALVPVSVNLNAEQFEDSGLPTYLMQLLATFQIQPNLLQLEITEGTLLKSSGMIAANLEIIRANGIQVSIDDFGTGYSSLSYLHKFKVDNIKIDRSFIAMSGQEHGEVSLVPAIIDISHSLGMSVTAEGVETVQQYDFLKRHQCDNIQGFLFSRPVPASQFAEMLTKGALSSST